MATAIRLVLQCSVPAGKDGEVKELLRSLIDTCKKNDPGLLSYEFFFNDTGSEMYAMEWYKDSAAVMTHMGIGGETLNQLLGTIQITRAEVFGNASDELIEAFEPFKAKFTKHWDGFTR
jgi:quinol monooxygenase YgiN